MLIEFGLHICWHEAPKLVAKMSAFGSKRKLSQAWDKSQGTTNAYAIPV